MSRVAVTLGRGGGVGGTLTVLTVAEGGRLALSMPDYQAIRDGSRAPEATAVCQGWRVALPEEDGLRVHLPAAAAPADFLRQLGARPVLGGYSGRRTGAGTRRPSSSATRRGRGTSTAGPTCSGSPHA